MIVLLLHNIRNILLSLLLSLRTELVWKVGRYTSASPIFFGEFENYVDGGVLANNPCDCGLTAIQNFYRLLGDRLLISIVVSVGTGVYPAEKLGKVDAQEFLFFGKHWFRLRDLKDRATNLISLLSNAVRMLQFLRTLYEDRTLTKIGA